MQRTRLRRLLPAAVALLAAAVMVGARHPSGAATTGLIVADSLSGLALGGFDPVAYFVDRRPQLGDGLNELIYRGAVWRFSNQGNRAAFARDPGVYAPRFGGYDPVAVARGVAVPGHPLIWLISGDRLYLFSRVDHRTSFSADVDRAVAAAERRWPEVQTKLVP
jgi:hypothetical protein